MNARSLTLAVIGAGARARIGIPVIADRGSLSDFGPGPDHRLQPVFAPKELGVKRRPFRNRSQEPVDAVQTGCQDADRVIATGHASMGKDTARHDQARAPDQPTNRDHAEPHQHFYQMSHRLTGPFLGNDSAFATKDALPEPRPRKTWLSNRSSPSNTMTLRGDHAL